jgi:hypothetical protein
MNIVSSGLLDFTFFAFLFFRFFCFFCFFSLFSALNFSLCFDLIIFASMRNNATQNSSLYFRFFRFFCFFSLNFCFAAFFLMKFLLFYLRFRFRFLVFRIEVNHVKSGFFSLPSEKRNFRFNFKFRFRSESEGAP